jgi:hypothetical protein
MASCFVGYFESLSTGRPDLKMMTTLRSFSLIFLFLILSGCLTTRGLSEIKADPYPVIQKGRSQVRYADPGDSVSIEVKTVKKTNPVKNLAIYYPTLFPGGLPVRAGDTEEYVRAQGKNAYKVTFKPTQIRNRKRYTEDDPIPPGWVKGKMEDADTGKTKEVLYGPVIRRQLVLYLIEGDTTVYYILLRAEGDEIENAKQKLERFVQNDIAYK